MLRPRTCRLQTLVAVLVSAAVLLACGDGSTNPGTDAGTAGTRTTATSGVTNTTTTEPAGEGDARSPEAAFDCNEQTGGNDGKWYLVEVREAAHEGFDRVVFEFEPVDAGSAGGPRYVARLAKPPFAEDPSDLPLALDAPAAVGITFLNASGVDLSGTEPRIVYEGPKEIETDHSPVTDVVEAGDFENTMTWLLGLDAQHCFDVLTLDDPPRIVVDVEH